MIARFLAIASVVAICGCGQPRAVRSRLVTVAVAMPGIATVEGRSTRIDELHLLLRKLGIAKHDRLEIMLPRDGERLYARVRVSLLKGGYRSVRYKLPPKNAAYVTPKGERRLRPRYR